MDSFFSSFSSSSFQGLPLPGLSSLLSTTPLSRTVQTYVIQVYQTLALMALVTALGVYTDYTLFSMVGSLGWVSFLCTFLACLAVYQLPKTKDYAAIRTGALYGFAYLKGLSLRPLISMAGYVSPTILPQAVVSTFLIFVSFTVAAIYAKKRTLLYVGAMLGSALSVLFWMNLFNLFFMSRAVFNANVYLGLLIFAGYIMYDTQIMIHQAVHNPFVDTLTLAMDLYINLISLFIRIVYLLTKNSQRREKEKEKRRNQ
ncbi:Bax inhibitor 1 [Coelomomyces lativittatus]|nr:Bax inhibitor 1 [Coelomomyces lativittatus]KAJ1509186.1 Bax inhibitor 1 [Coelomomyces lativittatus]KAJ1511610.1 Bax inhibitor 1 [Coelomomyces lativittatus]